MQIKSFSGTVLCIILCAALTFTASTESRADELTNDKIKESQSAIDDAKNAKEQLESGVTDAQAVIDSLQGSKNDVEKYVKELDSSMEDIQTKLNDIDQKISENKVQISKTEAALTSAEAIRDRQYESMKKQIKFMYESQETTFADIFFSSSGIGDLLNKTVYINALSDYDNKKLSEYAETVKNVESTKKQLDNDREELDKAKEDQKSEQASMQTLIDAKETEISAYSASIGDRQAQITEYKNMIAEQDAQIAALEAAIEAERKRLEEENRALKYDGGMFTFPCPSYTRISDDYGMRMHPTLNVEMMHNGIDIAAPSGSPILAAYNGTVAAAAYSSTMGNYIMIDHGDGLITIYMHASSLQVSAGDSVTAGQQIGLVGSTGRSTGPHLHFGVRLNGAYVSPWDYLK